MNSFLFSLVSVNYSKFLFLQGPQGKPETEKFNVNFDNKAHFSLSWVLRETSSLWNTKNGELL